jgi:hypothetical protein
MIHDLLQVCNRVPPVIPRMPQGAYWSAQCVNSTAEQCAPGKFRSQMGSGESHESLYEYDMQN